MLKLYKIDSENKFIGELFAAKHPIRTKDYLIPKNTTELSPFDVKATLDAGEYYYFNNKKWVVKSNKKKVKKAIKKTKTKTKIEQ